MKMKRGISNLIHSLAVVSLFMLLRCDLPDPTEPSKTTIKAVFKNAASVVYGNSVVDTVGKPLCIGAALYLPANFDSISFVIKENDVVTLDTMFRTFNDEYYFDTVWYSRTFSSEGIKNVTMTPFSNPILQPLSINIPIVPKPGAPVHISFSKNYTSATGSMPVQTYTSGKAIKLPENTFVNLGYKFSGWATTASGPVEYKDNDEITMGAEDLLLFAVWADGNSVTPPVIAHAPSQLIAGKADTLLFAVDNSSRPDPLTISLITKSPLDPSVFSIVPTGPDTIKIAIAQSVQSTSANIGIVTDNGTKSDTTWYPIKLISSEAALWKTTAKDLDAIEGSPVHLDLSQDLSAASGAGVTLSADIGTINGTTWNYTPKWGCAVKIPAIITAKKGDVSFALTISLTVVAGDTAKPKINLVDPSIDGKKVSSSQITLECKVTDAGAGVDSVLFAFGDKRVLGTLQGEDIYSGVITGLVHKTPTQITITAFDKSRQKNRGTLSFTVTRDSTLLDAEPPVIAKTAGPESGARVNDPKGSLTFTVNDNAGVDSVWWTLNDAFVGVLSASGENNYSIAYTLSTFGKNVIKLFAKDGSGSGNEGFQAITLNYNTEPTAIALTTPAANATGVSTSPTFTWSGGDDADGDGVTFTVNYGTAQTSLSNTAAVTGKTAVLSSPLAYAKTWYWQVTATSSSTAYPDKIQSAVGIFTTEGSLPAISAHPQSQTIEVGQGVTFTVTASGFGTLSYQWRENGKNITGANNASYKISSVTTSMNNNVYDCLVKNEVGEDTSDAAKLTVAEIPSFTVSFDMHGGTAIQNQTVLRGENTQEPSAPQRNNYAFKGWFTSSTYTTEYNFSTPITANQTIHAKWVDLYSVTYYSNNADGGTVPTDTKKYESGVFVTVVSNTGNLYKNGYSFAGWTPSQNGTGIVYNNPNTIQVGSAAINLYAKWEMNTPTITTPITDKNCPVNDAVTFTVVATGPGLSYEWQQNGVTISTATGASYTTSSLTAADVATTRIYKCIVTNSAGSKDCSAKLSVNSVNDIDGNVYHEVKIGTQVWMMENLKTTKYRDGSSIPNVTDPADWEALTTAGFCWYDNSSTISEQQKWGALYNWYVVSPTNSKTVAPEGWRVPTDADWTTLENNLISNGYSVDGGTGTEDHIAKAMASKNEWNSDERTGAVGNDATINNASGFSALPSGFRNYSGAVVKGTFDNRNYDAYWWSATEKVNSTTIAYNRYLNYSSSTLMRSEYQQKQFGYSVRLLKN
jgi:uncharacterized protein (TIGR02145 family)/uncharacterized repeat protein (TIGR02543 family)